jgi:hypothetical protein
MYKHEGISQSYIFLSVYITVVIMFSFPRFQRIEMASSNTEHILSGCRSTVLPMKMMALLGAAVVNEWRSVQGFISVNENSSPGQFLGGSRSLTNI